MIRKNNGHPPPGIYNPGRGVIAQGNPNVSRKYEKNREFIQTLFELPGAAGKSADVFTTDGPCSALDIYFNPRADLEGGMLPGGLTDAEYIFEVIGVAGNFQNTVAQGRYSDPVRNSISGNNVVQARGMAEKFRLVVTCVRPTQGKAAIAAMAYGLEAAGVPAIQAAPNGWLNNRQFATPGFQGIVTTAKAQVSTLTGYNNSGHTIFLAAYDSAVIPPVFPSTATIMGEVLVPTGTNYFLEYKPFQFFSRGVSWVASATSGGSPDATALVTCFTQFR